MPLSQYSDDFRGLLDQAATLEVTRGETIITTENIQGIYCVKAGFVKRFLIKNDGSISVQGVYGPGDCFGMNYMFNSLVRKHFYNGSEVYYYEAINDVVVYALHGAKLHKALNKHPELYRDLFIIQAWHGLSDVWLLESRGIKSAQKRVAHIIYFYMDRYGVLLQRGWECRIPFIQQDLADILDLTRETVSIALNELKKQELIKGTRKIVVPDLGKLKELAYS